MICVERQIEIINAIEPFLLNDLVTATFFRWIRIDPINNKVFIGTEKILDLNEQAIVDDQIKNKDFVSILQKNGLSIDGAVETYKFDANTAAGQRLTRARRAYQFGVEIIKKFTGQARYSMADRISAGDGISAGPSGGIGTLGWVFLLNDTPMGISCFHVLCQDEKAGIVTNVYDINGRKLGHVMPSGIANPRTGPLGPISCFDFAMFKFEDTSLSGKFGTDAKICEQCPSDKKEGCIDCSTAYPQEFGTITDISTNADYCVFGFETGYFQKTRFLGLGLIQQAVSNGASYLLKNQLFFENCSRGSDSGAVVFNKITKKIVGLVCFSSARFTVASPLYIDKRGMILGSQHWEFQNLSEFDGVKLPCYRAV